MPTAAELFQQMRDSPIAPWAVFRELGKLQRAPQQPNEPDILYGLRGPIPTMGNERQAIGQAIAPLLDTPAARASRAKPGDVFPNSFADPLWTTLESTVAQGYGNPTLASALAKLRTLGERSNSNQVSSAGAKTPYQITPETREGIMKQHGFDPWSSPENAVRGAAIAATTYTGPKANFNDPNVLAKAAGGYFGGKAGADNPFSSISDGGTTVAEYVGRVAGQMTNPYDPTMDRMALGSLEAGRQAALKPMDIFVPGGGPPPEMPKPEPIPTTDFSKADEALQALKPIEMSEKERLRRERTGFWRGLAQASANIRGDEGLGTLLLKLGGGALGGRMAARDEIEKEQDEFEDKMARYHAAVFQNEMGKAKVFADEAKAQVDQNNRYNLANWQTAYERWKGQRGTVDISGTNAVISREDENGNRQINILPIEGAVNAAFAQQQAQVFSSMGGRQMAGNQQITGFTNSIVGRLAIQQMSGGAVGREADAAAAAAPAFYGTYIATNGLTAELLGPDKAEDLEKSIGKQLLSMGLAPGTKDYIERRDRMVAQELAKGGAANPGFMQKMMQVGGTAGSFEALEAVQSRKINQKTDPKTGLTTETSSMKAADIFDPNSIGGTDLTPYGYVRR